MPRSLLLLLTFALLSCLPTQSLRAEEEPEAPVPGVPTPGVPTPGVPTPSMPPVQDEVRARIAAWLADLGDDSFRVREAARAGLEREGLRARDLLEAAARTDDPEVRRTVTDILARAPGVTRERPGDVHAGDFEALGRVSLDLRNVPLREALTSLGDRFGGQFRFPADLPEQRVTLRAKEVSCFTALGTLLKASGLRMPETFDAQGTAALVRATEDTLPVPQAFAGPLRIRVEEVTATRTFGRKPAPRYLVKLRLDWAPFVQLYRHETVRVEVARDPDGKPFLPAASMRRSVKHYVSARARSTTLEVHLQPGPEGCKQELGALEISVPMLMRYDRAKVTLDDTARIPVVLGVSGTPVEPGADESVSFLSLELSGQGQGQWITEYAARLMSDSARGTLEAYVREDGGRLTQLYVAGGRSREAGGTIRITARAYRARKGKPKSLVVAWYRREDPGELRFRLENIPLR